MTKVNNLVVYKKAIIMEKDINNILLETNKYLKTVDKFRDKYGIVRNVVSNLEDTITILNIHKNNLSKIIVNKGLISDE